MGKPFYSITLCTMKPFLFSVLVLVFTISCDKDKVIRTFEEEQILELAYSEDYTYPAGFYHEINDAGSPYYENSVSIRPLSERDHIWIELSTNDKNEARLWSDKSNEYSSDQQGTYSVKTKHINSLSSIGEIEEFVVISCTQEYIRQVISSQLLNRFSVSDTIIGKYNGELSLSKRKRTC